MNTRAYGRMGIPQARNRQKEVGFFTGIHNAHPHHAGVTVQQFHAAVPTDFLSADASAPGLRQNFCAQRIRPKFTRAGYRQPAQRSQHKTQYRAQCAANKKTSRR